MTYKIFKYDIPVLETFTLDLPRDADVIRIDDVEGKFFMWAIVDVDPTVPKVKRYFENYKTGQPFKTNPRDLKYLGFFKMFIMQELCLYVFENISSVRPFKDPIHDWTITDEYGNPRQALVRGEKPIEYTIPRQDMPPGIVEHNKQVELDGLVDPTSVTRNNY